MDILQAFNTKPQPLNFLFSGFLHGTIGAIVSPGGSGKSMYALQLATQLAGGETIANPLYLSSQSPKRVSYLPAEDPEVILHHRLFSVGNWYEDYEKATIAQNLQVFPVVGLQPNLFNAQWYDFLRKVAYGSDLMILDTLRRWHDKDENDAGAMAQLLAMLEAIAKEFNCSIIFLHHTSKATALNGAGGEQQASRGSSVLVDNIRWQLNLTKMNSAEAKKYSIDERQRGFFVKANVAKSNYGMPDCDKWYKRLDGGVLKAMDLEVKKEGDKGGY